MPRVNKEINLVEEPKLKQPLLPKFGYTQILVVLLVISSYFLGVYSTQLKDVQANPSAVQGATAQAAVVSPTPGKVNVGLGYYPIKGNKNAKVTLVEFGDLRCPFCEQWYTSVESQLMKDYVDTGKVKFAFRDYAFLGPASDTAANAVACANEQGKFWEMEDYFYKNQPPETDTSMYTVDNLTQVAGTLGMDTNQFQSCLSSTKYSSQIASDLSDGQKAGVSGTPTIFIDGIPIVGAQPYSAFKTVIDQELAKKS